MKRNQNAKRRQRRRTRRQQMQEAGKIIYPADTGREAHACVSSKLYQTREVCVWIPKRKAKEARISEALAPRRNAQESEVRVSSNRYETRVSTTECGTHKVCVLKCRQSNATISNTRSVSLLSCISKPKRESRVCSTECELRISEPCASEMSVSELRHKVNIRSPTARDRRELKSPRPQRIEASLFDPLPTDLRDYLTKKMSVHQITPLCCCERLITTMLSECHCNQSVFKRLSYTSVSCSAKKSHSRTRTFSERNTLSLLQTW